MKRVSGAACAVAAVVLGACGGSETGGDEGTCTPTTAASLTLTSSGVSRKAICVLPQGTVTFFNNDSQQHTIVGDGTCPAMDEIGAIPANANRSATFPSEQACPFRDGGNPSNTAFQGTVFVTALPASGPGH